MQPTLAANFAHIVRCTPTPTIIFVIISNISVNIKITERISAKLLKQFETNKLTNENYFQRNFQISSSVSLYPAFSFSLAYRRLWLFGIRVTLPWDMDSNNNTIEYKQKFILTKYEMFYLNKYR